MKTPYTGLVTPSAIERAEWARMSRALPLGNARNTYATIALPECVPNLRIADFDHFQEVYREWLVFNITPTDQGTNEN